MVSSQYTKNDFLFRIYLDKRTVFRLKDIALLSGESNFQSLNKKLNYYVRSGRLLNPRQGIYAKQGYKLEEMACSIFTPSYVSLEYVLQKSGVLFQYDPKITVISYLSRSVEIDRQQYTFRKIKSHVLLNTTGIVMSLDFTHARPERAFLDMLYLNKEYYFDYLDGLDKALVYKILPVYQSKILYMKVNKLLKND